MFALFTECPSFSSRSRWRTHHTRWRFFVAVGLKEPVTQILDAKERGDLGTSAWCRAIHADILHLRARVLATISSEARHSTLASRELRSYRLCLKLLSERRRP